ncbi:hypothetical protein [Pseudomarimonas arenosa]|uniref:Uncharacterized protein n=1 Tax=Pseudomarimonas arenosa TaxID=2774145 RepID=A0AAW3ZS83_9GAMM|nr:hypothetical protein [Pseudomarimonas arenosa]MBD8527091.1 hypothetical protein [Pseudomarimonas arenosa]
MRYWMMLAASVLSANALAAEPDGTKFWGSVVVDDQHIVSYYLTVPPGERAALSLGSGYSLQFESAPNGGSSGEAKVSLLDKKSKPLHERSMPGASPMNLSGAYAVCRGSVVYISPAPSEPASCDD